MAINSNIILSHFVKTISQSLSSNIQNTEILLNNSPLLLHKVGNVIFIPKHTLNLDKKSYKRQKLEEKAIGEKNIANELELCNEINDVIEVNNMNNLKDINDICPICGDNISGFHYGIFSCESCKGFFKRTVQNKKIFHCREFGNCEINKERRKRCPACRFAKCRHLGMKIEAIRIDRTRGGRTSYGTQHSLENYTLKRKITPNNSRVPPLLESAMSIDCLLDDDTQALCCENGKCFPSNDVVRWLIHTADHCLYRIVRWARNIPEFILVDTDSQISLLRNCWAELLAINCCWKSMQLCDAIKISATKIISVTEAESIGLGEVFRSISLLSSFFRHLEVDAYELAALKSVLLLSPDVSSLKKQNEVHLAQEKYIDALSKYISCKKPNIDNKYIKLLVKMAEFSRVGLQIKKIFDLQHINCYIPNQSLIFEFLKENLNITSSVTTD